MVGAPVPTKAHKGLVRRIESCFKLHKLSHDASLGACRLTLFPRVVIHKRIGDATKIELNVPTMIPVNRQKAKP